MTAVLSAALYVLVNGLYIEFYDDFGVRPEQVGFDRLAVLARSAWIALIAVAILGPIAYWSTRNHVRAKTEEFYALWREQHDGDTDLDRSDPWVERELAFMADIRERRRMLNLGLLSLLVLLVGYVWMAWQVDAEAEGAARGHNSNGIGWLVPFIDVRANRADVNWVDADRKPPPGLVGNHLMYLGSDGDVTVLLACGRATYVIQSSDIVVTLLDQGSASELSHEEEQAVFEEACAD